MTDTAQPLPAPPTSRAAPFALTFPPTEAAHVRHAYAQAATILEYGSGGSTVLAAEMGKTVTAVESDRNWADRLSLHLAAISDRARVHHVDIGPTRAWGHPENSRAWRQFHRYALSVWDSPDFQHPDLVLIDGRFRAACFAATMMRVTRPVTVLFDDYAERLYYHDVEQLFPVEDLVGRLARFTVSPRQIPPEMLTRMIGWFASPQ